MNRLFACLLLLVVANLTLAQEAAPAKKPRTPAAGRLPAFYSDIVSPDQKAKVYAVQAKFKEKLDPLTAEVKKIQAERDAEIEALLSPEQREKLTKAKAEAAAKRAAAAEAAKKAEDAAKKVDSITKELIKKADDAAKAAPPQPVIVIPSAKPATSTPAVK